MTDCCCCVCGRGLAQAEAQTCTRCRSTTRWNLRRVACLASEAQAAVTGWPTTSSLRPATRSRSAEQGLPVGDLGVMVGPGSEGAFWAAGDWGSRQPVNDNLPSDPVPVIWLLCQWEDAWRHELGMGCGQVTATAALATAVAFLDEHLPWAAAHHPGFADFAQDLRRARAALETQLRDGPQRSPVPCLTCGHRSLELAHPDDVRTVDDPRKAIQWRCGTCHRGYTTEEFWLAVHEHEKNQATNRQETR